MITCFAVAIIVFGVVSLVHVMYETIVLPSIRLHLRFKLFALRDRLRAMKLQHADGINDTLYDYMEGSINNAIKILPAINIHMIIKANERFNSDEKIRKLIEERKRLIDACSVNEIKSIRHELFFITGITFVLNSLMWSIYLLPIVGVIVFLKTIKNTVKELVCVPSYFVDSMLDSEKEFCPA